MHKQMLTMRLKKILEKYSRHPDFLGVSLAGVNQPGAIDDAVLHIASRKGEIEEVITLLSEGAEPNMPGDLGNTPLHYSAMTGNKEVVQVLLESGADKSIKNELQQTPYDVALLGGHREIASMLKV